ncbi:MAG: hypothetical protein IJ168_00100 [Eubacterium sp.]|nr:hypothetical protein [Eubacterium sp.]
MAKNSEETIYERVVNEDNRRAVFQRKCIAFVFFCALGIGLSFIKLPIPFTPKILSVEFSYIAVLLVAFTVHPLAGVAISVIKSAAVCIFIPSFVPSAVNKILVEVVSVLITYWLFKVTVRSRMLEKAEQKHVAKGKGKIDKVLPSLALSGLLGTVVSGAVTVLSVSYVLYPLQLRLSSVSSEEVLGYYQVAYGGLTRLLPFLTGLFPSMDSILVGAIVYNGPMTAAKCLFCALLLLAFYKPLNHLINEP